MVSGYAQTNLAIHLKTPRGREKAEVGRSKRVLRGQYYSPVVDAASIRGWRFGALDCEVPFENVVFQWFGMVVWRGGDGQLRGLFYCVVSGLCKGCGEKG